jgi:hypothetical protein
MTLGLTTIGVTTLNILPFCIALKNVPPCIKTLRITIFSISVVMLSVAFCNAMLDVVMLSVVTLNVAKSLMLVKTAPG